MGAMTTNERLREAARAMWYAHTEDERFAGPISDDPYGDFENALRAALAHDRPAGSGRLERMAREVAAGHRDEGGACRECGMGHPCHAWTLAFEILHPLSGSSDPEADEDIRADIRQAAMGGPDFTPMEWPESDPEADPILAEDRAMAAEGYFRGDPEAVGLAADADIRVEAREIIDYLYDTGDPMSTRSHDVLARALSEAKPETPA
jgi:hypothetical protein